MQKVIFGLAIAITLLPSLASAQGPFPPDQFYRARITKIEDAGTKQIIDLTVTYLKTTLEIVSGQEKGKTITIEDEDRFATIPDQAPKVGDVVVVRALLENDGSATYSIDDRYRINSLLFIALLFFALVCTFSRWKGVGALLGLGVSIAILYFFIVPQLVSGASPILITLVGALMIAAVSMFLAHGFTKQTGVALTGTLITLALSTLLAFFFTETAQLLGLGSESAFYLTANVGGNFDFSGLLLGGIIIGMLGVLDDVTTAQTATVAELKKANPNFSIKELYQRGLSVGREHISSLVNTLVLAYAGAGLPLFLLFSLNKLQPLWVTLNSEPIAEEIVRTLAGSVALVLAVPISTALAAYWLSRKIRH